MTTLIHSNQRNPEAITPDMVQAIISQAQTEYKNSKDRTAQALALAFISWRGSAAPSAHADMQVWTKQQFENFTAEVKAHNTTEDFLKDRAHRFSTNNLKDDDPLMVRATTEEEIEDQKQERKALEGLATLTSDQWKARRHVGIDERRGIADITSFLRFCFDIRRRSEASVLSRLVKVFEWTQEQFSNVEVNDHEEIVKAISDNGGFEEVLLIQRGVNVQKGETAADLKIINEAVVARAKQAIQSSESLSVFQRQIHDNVSGYVSLIGRYNNGNVEIVGVQSVAVDEVDKTLSSFGASALPTDDSVEFMANLISLGELVSVGDNTKYNVNDTKSGQPIKSERVVSLVPDRNAGVQLMVSARYAEASVIVKAYPKMKFIDPSVVTEPLALMSNAYGVLRGALNDDVRRRLVDVAIEADADDVVCVVENNALAAKSSPNAKKTLNFQSIGNQVHKPLDIDGYRRGFQLSISRNDLKKLYHDRLVAWSELKDDKKSTRRMKLAFTDGLATYNVDGQDDMAFSCQGQIAGRKTLEFRPRDLMNLVKVLIAQPVSAFDIEGDESGLLCVKWADGLGCYEVYLPTATLDNKLQSKRVGPLNVDSFLTLAA